MYYTYLAKGSATNSPPTSGSFFESRIKPYTHVELASQLYQFEFLAHFFQCVFLYINVTV